MMNKKIIFGKSIIILIILFLTLVTSVSATTLTDLRDSNLFWHVWKNDTGSLTGSTIIDRSPNSNNITMDNFSCDIESCDFNTYTNGTLDITFSENPISCMVVMNSTDPGAKFIMGDDGGNFILYYNFVSVGQFRAFNGAGESSNTSFITNGDINTYLVASNGTSVDFYRNGSLYTDTGTGIGSGNFNIFNIGDEGNTVNASIYITACFNETLSLSDAQFLHNEIELNRSYDLYSFQIPLNITFFSQIPSDINTTSMFYQKLNSTYNYTANTANLTEAWLNYSLQKTGGGCSVIINGTCDFNFSTFEKQSHYSNSSNYFSWFNNNNKVYPQTISLNESFFRTVLHNTFDMSNSNNIVSVKLTNISSLTKYNSFEFMVNQTVSGSSLLEVYYCNSSYSTGNPDVSNYCTVIASKNPTGSFDHRHTDYYQHQVFPFTINTTSEKIGGVGVTSDSYFLLSPTSNSGTWTAYYVNNYTGVDYSRTSSNTGATYTSQTYTWDSHIHQFTGKEYVYYQACGNFTTGIDCTDFQNDTLDVSPLPPTPPIITYPTFDLTINDSTINFTYTPAVALIGNITYYNITLLNSDGSFNQTLKGNNSLNLSYYWSIPKNNITVGNYEVKVTAFDTNGLNSSSVIPFTINANAELNITVFDLLAGGTVSNFTVNISNVNKSYSNIYSSTTGSTLAGVVFGDTYNISVNAPGYANNNNTELIVIDEYFDSVNFSLFITNTLNITFLHENNFSVVDGTNITLELISDLISANYSTSNGTLYLTLLTPENYTMRYTAPGYAERFYFFNLINQTFNTLTLYMIQSSVSENITVDVIDQNLNDVENARVKALKYDINTNTYLLQEIGITNVLGETILSLTKNDEYYKFIVDLNGETLLTTNPAYITSNSIVLQVVIGQEVGEVYQNYLSIDHSLSFNTATNNFRLEYNDVNGITNQICLQVEKVSVTTKTLLNTTCTSSSSGTILLPVTPINNTLYVAKAIYKEEGGSYMVLDKLAYYFSGSIPLGNLGLFLQVILTTVAIFIGVWSLPTAVIAAPLTLLLGRIIGLNSIDYQYLIPLMTVALIITFIVGRRDR